MTNSPVIYGVNYQSFADSGVAAFPDVEKNLNGDVTKPELVRQRSLMERTFSKIEPGSLRSSMFTLASSAIGAGVLSLPLVLKNCGIVMGVVLLVVGALLALLSIEMLVQCGNETGIRSYSDLATLVFGRRVSQCLELILVIYCFGACVAYLIIISQSVHSIVGPIPRSVWGNENAAVVLLTVLVVFPLSLMRNLSSLRYATIFSVLSMLYVSIAVVTRGIQGPNRVSLSGAQMAIVDWRVVQSATITFFAYTCHVNVFTVYAELNNPLIRRMQKVTRRAVGLEIFLYTIVAVFGYLSFHEHTSGNILQNYDGEDAMIGLGRMAVGLNMVIALPLNFNPCRANLDLVLFPGRPFSPLRHTILTIVLVFPALALAIMIPQVSTVFGLLGATCSVAVCYVMPFLSYLHVFGDKLSRAHKVTLMALLLVIVCVGGASVVASVIDLRK